MAENSNDDQAASRDLWEQMRVSAQHLAQLAEHPKPDDEQWLSWVVGCVNGINAAADVLVPEEEAEATLRGPIT